MSEHEQDQEVVVGVDGSPSSRRALDWALRQAEATGAKVVAVAAWREPTDFGVGVSATPGVQWDDEARAALVATIAIASAKRPNARVEPRVVEGHPAAVLLDQAEHADMLVVGSRGHGGFMGALLGSVSQHCVINARCPVVVVHDRV